MSKGGGGGTKFRLANEEASCEKDENYTDGKDTNASRIKRHSETVAYDCLFSRA